jgi:DNA-binding MarR family transcriptional regulator
VIQGLGDDFQAAFWAAKRAMFDAGEAAFQRHGVRSGQQWILRCLWTTDGRTPGEIAKELELSTPTVTKAAMRMETSGLVERRPDPRDARLVRLYLTDRGKTLETTIRDEMTELSRRALSTLSPAEVEALVHILTSIRKNLASS